MNDIEWGTLLIVIGIPVLVGIIFAWYWGILAFLLMRIING